MMRSDRLFMGTILGVSLCALVMTTIAPAPEPPSRTPIAFLQATPEWASKVVDTMSLSSKLGQLLYVAAPYQAADAPSDSLVALIRQYRIGGLAINGYDYEQLTRRLSLYQQASEVPLLMGLLPGSYASDLLQLPDGLALASLPDDSLPSWIGEQLAMQAREVGVHMMFIPSLEAAYERNSIPALTHTINQLTVPLQSHHVMACVGPMRPFLPAFSDTATHDSLLFPYRQLMEVGTASWTLGAAPPPTYHGSPEPVCAIGSKRLPYQGLVMGQVPDSVRDMTGVLRRLLKQGSEMFYLAPRQVAEVSRSLETLVRTGELNMPEIDRAVKRILLAKTWTGAITPVRIPRPDTLPSVQFAQYELHQRNISVLRNPGSVVPLSPWRTESLHIRHLGQRLPHVVSQARYYGPVSHSALRGTLARQLSDPYLNQFEHLIFTLTPEVAEELKDPEVLEAWEKRKRHGSVALLYMGDPAGLVDLPKDFPLLHTFQSDSLAQVLMTQALMGGIPARGHMAVSLSPDISWGMHSPTAQSRLGYAPPEAVQMNPRILAHIDTIVAEAIRRQAFPGCQVLVARKGQVVFHKAYGHHTRTRSRRVREDHLYDVASMTKVAATTVGAMMLVGQDTLALGDSLKDFFSDVYTWEDTAVRQDTQWIVHTSIPDSIQFLDTPSAPIVQVSLPTQRTRGMQAPPDRIDSIHYTSDSLCIISSWIGGRVRRRSRVMDVTVGELLTHHSGLPAGLPILPYLTYRKRGLPRFGYYFKSREDSLYSVEVAKRFYLRRDFLDSLWQMTKAMYVDPTKDYRYSDANLILVQQAMDSLLGYSIDSFLTASLYGPLGMYHSGYNPLQRAEEESDDHIVPTANDRGWRNQLLRGHVHDETAALLGGISGNAGLFSTTNDLAHLFQMLLNGGTYGGERFMPSRVVRTFTQRQAGHRAFGFDMPPREDAYIVSRYAPPTSYGHTGFTGTCVWVDPETELVYIFLSNRVHPEPRNYAISALKVRERIHDVIYEACTDLELHARVPEWPALSMRGEK